MKDIILPETGFVRLPTILKFIPVGKSTWWARVKTGEYPKPIKLGKNITVWKVEDIRGLINVLSGVSTVEVTAEIKEKSTVSRWV